MDEPIPEPVYEILKEALNEDIENFQVTLQDANKKGDGFSGRIFFVRLESKRDHQILNYVVKLALSDPNVRRIHPVREAFVNEIYFYTILWPKFKRFEERIPPEYRFIHLPECFATNFEENLEMVVLENLKYKDFAIHDKKVPFGKEMFEYIFQVYAKFHAISFAYKALDPEGFLELIEGVTDVWNLYLQKQLFQDVLKSAHAQCLDALQPGVDDVVIEKYSHYVDDGLDLTLKSLINGKYTAIVHGDCWSNNILFQYDESKKLIAMRMLDFQNLRLGSPVCDLSYCLYSGGTREAFDSLDHLLQVYHDSLSESLIVFGCDPQVLYPLEALKGDWKIYCQLGVSMGVSLWRAKLTYEGQETDLTDARQGQQANNFFGDNFDKKTYRERMRDLVYHLYDNDYLY